MKIIRLKDIEGTDRDVSFNAGRSVRFILRKDNMGFSLHKTIILKGTKSNWHYKHHLEACYCVMGKGVITNLENGNSYSIGVDDCYLLDNNDDHTFEALEDVVLISVFNPPVIGDEIHLEDGSYKRSDNFKDISKQIVQAVNCSKNNYDAREIVANILTINK